MYTNHPAITGIFYDGKTSAEIACRLVCGDIVQLLDDANQGLRTASVADLVVTSRVGNTPRFIHFPCGGKFTTADNDAVDHWLQTAAPGQNGLFKRLLSRAENHYGYVLVALALVSLLVFGFIRYGVPQLSTVIAGWLPDALVEEVGTETLAMMDQRLFKPSALDETRQQELRVLFEATFADVSADRQQVLPLRLHLRRAGAIGPNAFALPSGDIIVTDALVKLSADNRELLAVMAHEVGHVVNRHGMRRLTQSMMLVLLVSALTGDVSSLVAGAPIFLLELSYSREFELEADRYAIAFMQQQGIDLSHYQSIMGRLETAMTKTAGKEANNAELGMQGYLSSHPSFAERLQLLEQ